MKCRLVTILLACLFIQSCTDQASYDDVQRNKQDTILIHTPLGAMTFVLFNETPRHKQNFLEKIDQHFYDSLLFHRVQPHFMIQGGDPTSRGEVGPAMVLGQGGQANFLDAEINNQFVMCKGALVAFHDGVKKNPSKQSNSAQFMIIHGQALKPFHLASQERKIPYTDQQVELYLSRGGCPQLDGQFTIFGQLTDGWHVLDKIANSRTFRIDNPHLPDRPIKDIRMSIHRLN